MDGLVDALKWKKKTAILEKFVDGAAAAGSVAIVVNGNEPARHDSFVELFETQFDGLVPVDVDVLKGDLRDVDGRKGVLE